MGLQFAQLAAFGAFVFVLSQLRVATTAEGSSAVWVTSITVTPGDTSVERGTSLPVLARFKGPLPPDVTLVIRPDAQGAKRIPLVKSLDDPLFGATVPKVAADLSYYIAYNGEQTRDYKVRVFDYPKLERSDAQLTFPEYTGLPAKKITDTRRVSAVDAARSVAVLDDDTEVPFDLFLGVPKHRAPDVVIASGMTSPSGVMASTRAGWPPCARCPLLIAARKQAA